MSEPRESTGVADDAQGALADLVELIALRRELIEVEIRSDLAAAKRLGMSGVTGIVLVLIALPMVVMVAAGQADRWTGWSFPWVSLSTALLLLLAGVCTTWLAQRRFRRDFQGLKESLAELQEDVVWLREWLGGK